MSKNTNLKLYIWNDPFTIPYGGSILCVVAYNLKSARTHGLNVICKDYGVRSSAYAEASQTIVTQAPRVIRKFPCAKFYHWEE